MHSIQGTILNIFVTPQGVADDGGIYGGKYMVQIQGLCTLKNGEQRVELLTLKTDDPEPFQKLRSKEVLVPVGAWSPAKGQVKYYLTGQPKMISQPSQ
jgi:hypothetical protein